MWFCAGGRPEVTQGGFVAETDGVHPQFFCPSARFGCCADLRTPTVGKHAVLFPRLRKIKTTGGADGGDNDRQRAPGLNFG